MEKIQFSDLNTSRKVLLSKSETSLIYKLENGDILKIFSPLVFLVHNVENINLESKIVDSRPLLTVPEIIIPKQGVYVHDNLVGYTMPMAQGIDLNTYDENLSLRQRTNLKMYADIFNQLESIVKRAHKEKIIFPDLCTCDNIFISNGRLSFIDYDGLQIGNHKAIARSSSLGTDIEFESIPKYCKNGLFTEELDKRGLVILYFLQAFNINLNMIGAKTPLGDIITFEDIFETINLKDYDFMHKVWKCLHEKENGEYIGEDVLRLSYDYDMYVREFNGGYLKRLERKRKM